MTNPAVPDDVTTAASIIAMKIVANHTKLWVDATVRYEVVASGSYATIGDENWQLVLAAIKQTAEAMMPEPKLYDSALKTLQETAQNVAVATEGVN